MDYSARRSVFCRTPRGVCGLKLSDGSYTVAMFSSHSARGVWIETSGLRYIIHSYPSHSARGVWIETINTVYYFNCSESHSARGVWIETLRLE